MLSHINIGENCIENKMWFIIFYPLPCCSFLLSLGGRVRVGTFHLDRRIFIHRYVETSKVPTFLRERHSQYFIKYVGLYRIFSHSRL